MMSRLMKIAFYFLSICCIVYIIQSLSSDQQGVIKFISRYKVRLNATNSADDYDFTKESQTTRKYHIQEFCLHHRYDKSLKYDENLMYIDKQRIIYCHVPKVACTTWKKIMAYFMGYVKSPWDVHSMTQLYSFRMNYLKDLADDKNKKLKTVKDEYFSFMFSRHPYDRLFSAYRNKFLNPLNYSKGYLKHYGPMIISSDINPLAPHPTRADGLYTISFEQFVRFVLKAGPDFDDHWRPQTRICHVCHLDFKFLGKFETLEEDANFIFKELKDPLTFPTFGGEYKHKTTDMLKTYYRKLPKHLLNEIYRFYKADFQAFGYDPNEYF